MYTKHSTTGYVVSDGDQGAAVPCHSVAPWRERRPGSAAPLVTSRNKCDATPFRWPRPYVQRCGQGSLALYHSDGRVRFTALACGSWSCPTCRKRNAARLLDRARRGMESRPDLNRWLITLTCDPLARGAVVLGSRRQDDGRVTNIVSEPSPEQFRAAAEEFQRNWERLRQAWGAYCKRRGWGRPGYLRVIELHRNGWPHWHIVVEHEHLSTADLEGFLERLWSLGRTDIRAVDIDGAVGEIVPYLVAAERKSGGDKAYQFAALALPKNFRLWSSSEGFLAESEVEELPDVEHGVAIAGDVTSWYEALDQVAESRVWLMHPPQEDGSYRPPDAFVARGGNVVAFYAELVRATALHQRMHVSGFLAEFGKTRKEVQGDSTGSSGATEGRPEGRRRKSLGRNTGNAAGYGLEAQGTAQILRN